MRKRNAIFKNGILISAFGAGMILACFLPAKFLIGILATVIVILGLYSAKCC
jgi:hypothetical protein